MNEDSKSVKNGIVANRVLIVTVLVVLVMFMSLAVCAGVAVYKEYTRIKPVMDAMSKVNFKEIEQALSSIDKDTVSKITEAIDSVNEMSQSIDVNKLEGAIDSLTGAAEELDELKEALEPVLKFFGR